MSSEQNKKSKVLEEAAVKTAATEEPKEVTVESVTLDELKKHLLFQKKISQSKDDVHRLAEDIISVIEYINRLNEFDATCFSESIPLADVKIHSAFADFIRPRTVRYINSDRTNKDLLMRSEKSDTNMSYAFVMGVWKRFNGLGKKAADDDLVSLATVRIDKSFEDVRLKAYYPNSSTQVRDENNDFYPIPLSLDANALFDEGYLNVEVIVMIRRYFANKIFY